MCGVVAIHAYGEDAPPISRAELARSRAALHRRGPDHSGEWLDPSKGVGLGHTRLSILDLGERAAQPMCGDDLVIVYNGEIYNHLSLRAELIAKGYRFRTTGDTEVILHLYREHGKTMLSRLRGMFAFVLWDAARRTLFCARDPYGIKPMYYADDGRTIRLGSQVKSLLAGGEIGATPDSAGLVGFCLFGHLPEPYTTVKQIRCLPAGSSLSVEAGRGPRIERYFSLARCWQGNEHDSTAPGAARAALAESVAAHLVSDVPVGVFLSSGIDSCAVLGLMRQSTAREIDAVTLTFDEFAGSEDDESPLAGEVARSYQARHHEIRISLGEVSQCLDDFFEDMDQPSIDGLNTWLVSRAAAGLGLKVSLSGLGGDELLGGYPSFADLPRWVRSGRRLGWMPGLGALTRGGLSLARLLGATISPKAEGLAGMAHSWPGAYLVRRGLFMPWELQQLLGDDIASDGMDRLRPFELIGETIKPDPGFDFGRVATLESALYLRNQLLRDADWAGMSHSLEIRTPLVDATLLQTLAPMLRDAARLRDKSVLANSPRRPLPDGLKRRRKTGFTVPVGQWLEKLPSLDAWNRVPALRAPGCHWARRWAYNIIAPHLEAA